MIILLGKREIQELENVKEKSSFNEIPYSMWREGKCRVNWWVQYEMKCGKEM